MNILIAGSECAPYLKSGGLGDVLGALPQALAGRGHDVKLFLPKYRGLKALPATRAILREKLSIRVGDKGYEISAFSYKFNKSSFEIVLVDQPELFDRDGLYADKTGQEFVDNDERFILFNHAIFEITRSLGWSPDIIHAHDWQTALLPVLLRTTFDGETIFENTRSVLTIHNLAYQGLFDVPTFKKLGLEESLFLPAAPFEFYGKVNFLKAGIVFADHLTTVSPTYAREIQSDGELGCGLDGVLRERAASLTGILNGVDYTVWSPSRDSKIFHRYHKANLSGKRTNKVELLNRAKLPIRERTPLIGVISRLVDQKGFDLIKECAEEMFSRDLQCIILGTGEEKYHEFLEALEQNYPDKFKAYLTFDDNLAHLIEAAADIYLMPSRFEPCGLNQMYSLKYGTVPVVRRTGGLADSVTEFDEATGHGNGFLFDDYDSSARLSALDRAMAAYTHKRVWTKLMKSGMGADNSWRNVATNYDSLFSQIMSEKKITCA